MAKRQYRSEALGAVHETAEDMVGLGVIPKKRMKVYDDLCLKPPKKMKPKEIRALRHREKATQEAFARYLRVTPGLVSQWERGEKTPGGPSSMLLALVEKEGLGLLARV